MIRSLVNKTVVSIYRVIAMLVLFGCLFSVVAYAAIMGFYAVSNSWIAPTVLAKSDAISLDLTEKFLTSRKMVEDLTLDVQRLNRGVAEQSQHKAHLSALLPALDIAIARERAHNILTGELLDELDTQKRADIVRVNDTLNQSQELSAQLRNDLRLGLISKSDAALAEVGLTQFQSGSTDGQIAEIAVRDGILGKRTLDTKTLDTMSKRVELVSEINQIDIGIQIARQQIADETIQIERLKDAISTAGNTPYLHDGVFAFATYDTNVKVNAAVYDCYLSVIACRQVGTVTRTFEGEIHATHPIFRTDLRGSLVQLSLTHSESAKSKTLFVGGKPLWF